MKRINMQDSRYVQRSNLDQLETESEVSEPKHVTSGNKSTIGRLFVLELSSGQIFSLNADGSDRKIIVSGCRHPDGIVVDVESGHIYWTNMGNPNLNDGSIERADLNGLNRKVIVPEGGTFTPKQIHLDKKNGKLYWCDREGMRVMRSNLDGSKIETLIENGKGDADRRVLYWTDRGDPPRGNTVNRARIEEGEQKKFLAPEILLTHLMEGIGIALDPKGDRMFITDLGGSIYSSKLDGSDKKILLAAQGNLSGIAYSEVSSKYV